MSYRRAVIVVVALASAAGAEPSPDHAKAVELFEDGRRLMSNHDPAGACAKFAESIRLEPLAAGTMLNLGQCHEQLDHYKTALYWFRKAQIRATETDPPMPAYEQEAREHTTHLATVVATIKIDAARAPQDVQVSIDDEPVRVDDYAHVEIDPGHHVLVATATGKATFRQELDVTGRGGQIVVLVFRDVAQTATQEPPAIVVSESSGPQKRMISRYVAIGAGALLGGSLILTLYEKHVYNQYKDAAMRGDPVALGETRQATEIARDYGTILALAGLAAAGVAGYLYVTSPSEQTVVAPTLAPGQVGAVVMGRF